MTAGFRLLSISVSNKSTNPCISHCLFLRDAFNTCQHLTCSEKRRLCDETTQTKKQLPWDLSSLSAHTHTEDWGCRPGWIWNVSCISHPELNYSLQGMKSPVNCCLSTWQEKNSTLNSKAMCTLFHMYWLHQIFEVMTN